MVNKCFTLSLIYYLLIYTLHIYTYIFKKTKKYTKKMQNFTDQNKQKKRKTLTKMKPKIQQQQLHDDLTKFLFILTFYKL